MRGSRLLLACGLAPTMFAAVVLLEGVTRPGYNALHRFSSELSLGEYGWIQITNFIVAGVLALCFAVGLRRALRTGRGSRATPILTGVFGLSLIVAGIFVTDPKPGFPPGTGDTAGAATVHGTLHDFAGYVMVLAMCAAIFTLATRFAREPGRRPWRWYSIGTGTTVLLSAVAMAVLAGRAAVNGDGGATYHGFAQRVTLVVGFVWFSAIALLLLRSGDRVPAPPLLGAQPEEQVAGSG